MITNKTIVTLNNHEHFIITTLIIFLICSPQKEYYCKNRRCVKFGSVDFTYVVKYRTYNFHDSCNTYANLYALFVPRLKIPERHKYFIISNITIIISIMHLVLIFGNKVRKPVHPIE